MSSISELWTKSKETFAEKTVAQILSFTGDGKLRDNNQTSAEFRELLDQVPSLLLKQFAENCLSEKFTDSGLALQDVINQIGIRLGFTVAYGRYRGNQNDIAYDGIWTSGGEHSLVVEVKTTDAYRINLDTISGYRTRLFEKGLISKEGSSILVVVGRQDTGDLEAQIRGSTHAWDIRLLSTDSLLKLLSLKETLNDTKTIRQINELLKPKEYTRIDKLIDLIFLTTKDLQLDEPEESEVEEIIKLKKKKLTEPKFTPVNFHEGCLDNIQDKFSINFIKQSRISYTNKDKTVALICAISKAHEQGKNKKFWFAFHPHQAEFLKEYPEAYVAYGCGSPEDTFLIPFKNFEPLVNQMWTTENEDRMYWHVVIHNREKKFLLQQPKNEKSRLLEITKYKL